MAASAGITTLTVSEPSAARAKCGCEVPAGAGRLAKATAIAPSIDPTWVRPPAGDPTSRSVAVNEACGTPLSRTSGTVIPICVNRWCSTCDTGVRRLP